MPPLPELAALLVAITGMAAAIAAGVRNLRGDKFKREVDASAALLSGYTSWVERLQAEITRLQAAHTQERDQWRVDREEMRAEHHAEVVELNERIDELGSQVYVLQNRPSETRERESDG